MAASRSRMSSRVIIVTGWAWVSVEKELASMPSMMYWLQV